MRSKLGTKRKLPKQLFIVEAQAIEVILRRAVNHALLMHKRAGNPVASWKDGKVIWIPAEEIKVPTDATEEQS
jgi:hypothetical protein